MSVKKRDIEYSNNLVKEKMAAMAGRSMESNVFGGSI